MTIGSEDESREGAESEQLPFRKYVIRNKRYTKQKICQKFISIQTVKNTFH